MGGYLDPQSLSVEAALIHGRSLCRLVSIGMVRRAAASGEKMFSRRKAWQVVVSKSNEFQDLSALSCVWRLYRQYASIRSLSASHALSCVSAYALVQGFCQL